MLLGKSSERKIPWAQLLIEAALVVFSVLLALGVKSCNDARVQEDLANQALRNFKLEVVENKAEIDRVFEYHKSLVDSFRGDNPSTSIKLRSPDIQNNAWEVAQSTGAISYIDFSIVEIASKIEEKQTQYQKFLDTTYELVLDYNFKSDLNPQRVSHGLESLAVGMVNNEVQLLKLYREALKRMQGAGIAGENDTTRTK